MFSELDIGQKRKLLLSGAVILLVVIFFASVLMSQAKPAALDQNGCLISKPINGQTLVLVDNTDPFTQFQIQEFQNDMDQLRDKVSPWGMLTLAAIRELPPLIRISRCSPPPVKSAADWSPLKHFSTSWLQAAVEFEKAFVNPLKEELAQMPFNSEAPLSPIVESIGSVIESLGPYWPATGPRNLIIFSDMMENTSAFTQYSRRSISAGYDADVRKAPYLGTKIDLAGADVTIYYVLGLPDDRGFQGSAHMRFWRDFFLANGADHVKFVDFPSG